MDRYTQSRRFHPALLLLCIIPLFACELSFGTGGVAVKPTAVPLPTKVVLATNTSRPSPVPPTVTPSATPFPTPTPTPVAQGFGAVQFAVAVTEDYQPIDVGSVFPDGITLVYAVFPYTNLRADAMYRVEWRRDGQLLPIGFEEKWRGETNGNWWTNVYNEQGLTTGTWEVRLYLDAHLEQTASFTVGRNPENQPDFGPITFASGKSATDQPLSRVKVDHPVLPYGVDTVYAFYRGIKVPQDMQYTTQWFHNGVIFTDVARWTWNNAPDYRIWNSVFDKDGTPLEEGVYVLEIKIGERLVNVGTFTVSKSVALQPTSTPSLALETPTVAAAERFGTITFGAGVRGDEFPIDPLIIFPEGVTIVYAFFDYHDMTDGEAWRTEWFRDGVAQPNVNKQGTWQGGASGTWWVSVFNDQGITPGNWELNLYLSDTLQQTAAFTIVAHTAGAPDFGAITFGEGERGNEPINPIKHDVPTFPTAPKQVYAFFDAADMPKGTQWSSEWYYNGERAFAPNVREWDSKPSEHNWWIKCDASCFGRNENDPLPSGAYELKLKIGAEVSSIGTFIVK